MEISPELLAQARYYFKKFNHFMIWMWRLGLGSYINLLPDVVGRIMVLVHTGRKTGEKHRTPVNYVEIEGDIYCTAGFGKAADWYRNILKQPQVEVWLPDGWWQGLVEDISRDPNRTEYMRQVLIASGFAAHSVGIHPLEMSADQIAAATAEYKLLRIRRTAACTGPGGPGDLAWVWPAATFLLLPLALRRPRK